MWETTKRILLAAAVIAAAAVMAYAISTAVNGSRDAAQQAGQRAFQAAVARSESQLQRALLGECNGRNSLTRQVDATHRVVHHTLTEAAKLTTVGSRSRTAREPPAFRRLERRLAAEYLANARRIKGVSETDCRQELQHPLTYKQPRAVPFTG